MSAEESDRLIDRLKSDREAERLSAAREVLERDTVAPEIDQAVREAVARETVPWVRGVLAEIVAVTDGADWNAGIEVPAPSWDTELDGLEPDVARQLIHTSTRRVLHEVAGAVGRAKLAASGELGHDYPGSDTARELDFLSDVCGALRALSAATHTPELVEFDLADELSKLGQIVADERLCPIQCNGPGPFIVHSDRGLVRLAVQNILVNAVEATLSIGAASDDRAVVLTWGVSARGFHVSVIDRGPGPPRFLAAIRKAGVSTKEGHPGYGLATTTEALRSVGGTVHIRRNDRGGATVVLSWTEL
jgi:signal transduction histidine kinase